MDQLTYRGAASSTLVDQHIGERIRQRRTLLGFTQEQLADALNISYQQVQKYETGANRVSASRLFQIALRLDTEVGFFFDGLFFGDNEDDDVLGPASSRAIIDLVRSFQRIDDDETRASLVALVKTMANRDEADVHAPKRRNGHRSAEAP